MEANARKKGIVGECLALLVERGLTNTTTRDLSRAMKLQNSGMYYYFASKEDLIIACAEEAILQVEERIIRPAVFLAREPRRMIEQLTETAREASPIMKFFVSVCADRRYEESMKPVLARQSTRYARYAADFADALNADAREITPFIYMMFTAISNYMVYGEKTFISPQLRAVQIKFERLTENDPAE